MSRNRNNDRKDLKDKPSNKRTYSRNNRRENGRSDKLEAANKRADKFDGLNDISWYSQNPLLLEAAGRWPFAKRPGMAYLMEGEDTTLTALSTVQHAMVPGVMSFSYVPSVGYSDSVTSPASIAARELYARVRAAFSGSLDEDAPDLFMYLVALDQIHATIAHIKRVYGLLNTYNGDNYDYPLNMLRALGISEAQANDLRKAKTAIWGRLNNDIYNANKFCVPAKFHLFSRHKWMNENVYLDEPSKMAQSFIFVPAKMYVVDDTTSTGTSLNAVNVWTTSSSLAPTTVDKLFYALENAIDQLSGWGDAYTIDGHLRRAFEGESWLGSEVISEDYKVDPIYAPEVLLQIENLHAVNVLTDSLAVTQDPTTNAVIHKPVVKVMTDIALGTQMFYKPYLNIHSDAPQATDVVVASRLAAFADYTKAAVVTPSESALPVIAGTEIVTGIDYYLGTAASGMVHQDLRANDGTSVTSYWALDEALFSWWTHSPIRTVTIMSDATHILETRVVGDLHNFNTFTFDMLRDLNRVCVLSEFNCYA